MEINKNKLFITANAENATDAKELLNDLEVLNEKFELEISLTISSLVNFE